MARVSITEREKKREKTVAKYAEKRRALKAIIGTAAHRKKSAGRRN